MFSWVTVVSPAHNVLLVKFILHISRCGRCNLSCCSSYSPASWGKVVGSRMLSLPSMYLQKVNQVV